MKKPIITKLHFCANQDAICASCTKDERDRNPTDYACWKPVPAPAAPDYDGPIDFDSDTEEYRHYSEIGLSATIGEFQDTIAEMKEDIRYKIAEIARLTAIIDPLKAEITRLRACASPVTDHSCEACVHYHDSSDDEKKSCWNCNKDHDLWESKVLRNGPLSPAAVIAWIEEHGLIESDPSGYYTHKQTTATIDLDEFKAWLAQYPSQEPARWLLTYLDRATDHSRVEFFENETDARQRAHELTFWKPVSNIQLYRVVTTSPATDAED